MPTQGRSRGGNPGSQAVVRDPFDTTNITSHLIQFAIPGGWQPDDLSDEDDLEALVEEQAAKAEAAGERWRAMEREQPVIAGSGRPSGDSPEGLQNGSGAAQRPEAGASPSPSVPTKVAGEWRQYAVALTPQSNLVICPVEWRGGEPVRVRAWVGSDEHLGVNVSLHTKATVSELVAVADTKGQVVDAQRKVVALLAFMHASLRQAQEQEDDVWLPAAGMDSPRPNLRYYFDGLMEVGRESTFFGPFGAGKTWLVEGVVVSLTHGVEVVPGFVPRKGPQRVLYLDWDEGRDKAIARERAVLQGAGLTENGNFMFKHMRGTLRESFSVIAKDVAAFEPDVIVISNRESAIGTGAEGSDPGAGVMEAHHMLAEFGCGVIYIDHVIGEDLESRSVAKPYGSVKKMNIDRGAMHVYAQHKEQDVLEVVLTMTKPDSHEYGADDHAVRIEFARGQAHGAYDRVTYAPCEVRKRRPFGGRQGGDRGRQEGSLPPAIQRLMEVLSDGPMHYEEVGQRTGWSPSTVKANKSKAVRKHGITITEAGGVYTLNAPVR